MRIIAGTHRGRPLLAPKDTRIRPSSDRLRETVFNVLTHRFPDSLTGPVADLCCGTGALGLEALSRGAPSCDFNDLSPESLALTRENIEALGLEERARLVPGDAGALPCPETAYSLVFLDPPYGEAGLYDKILNRLCQPGLLAQEGLIVVEHEKTRPPALPESLSCLVEKKVGQTGLWFLQMTLS